MPFFLVPAIPGVSEGFSADANDIRLLTGSHGLPAHSSSEGVHLCGSCSSVLDVAAHLVRQDLLCVWDSVLASRQWAGRGQLRRNWVSEPGNLFAAWRLPLPDRKWSRVLPVVLGWILCRGFAEMNVPLQLKWPNDLLLHGRKVGGILIEERGDVLLAGIGLNMVSCPDDRSMRQDKACPAGIMGEIVAETSLLGLWLRLVHFCRLRYTYELSDLTPLEFSQSVETVLAFFGASVCVSDNRSSICGTYAGLSPDGGILLDVEGKRRVIHHGSLFPAE